MRVSTAPASFWERMGLIREQKDVAVQSSSADTYDRFKGVDLGFLKVGRFSRANHEVKKETVEDRPGAELLRQSLQKAGHFHKVAVDPTAERTTTVDGDEVFRGIAFGSRWKSGRFEVKTSTQVSESFAVSGEVPVGGGWATMKSRISVGSPLPTTHQESRLSLFPVRLP